MICLAVITHNRAPVLTGTLFALGRLTRTPVRLAVADDGSDDGTRALLDEVGARYVTGEHRGAAWNRNRALYWAFVRADADVLLMLDDDVQPVEEGWERWWIRGAWEFGAVFYGYQLREPAREPRYTPDTGAGCIALTRHMFERIGYFDPAYCAGWAFEDADYRRRVGRLMRWPQGEGPALNCGIRHLAAGSHYDADAYERNRAIYEADADRSVFRVPWRTEAERMEFLGEQL